MNGPVPTGGWGTALLAGLLVGLGHPGLAQEETARDATRPGAELPREKQVTNSVGMKLVRIEAGRFEMGRAPAPIRDDLGLLANDGKPGKGQYPPNGDYDESPRHPVTISRPFYLGAHEVTNAQYEQFDPEHRKLRGKLGFSQGDDEAVLFVSWDDAEHFCRWLSHKEGRPYRLPTEAEWEYACRAGTDTLFSTGDTLPDVYFKHNRIPRRGGPDWYPTRQVGAREATVPLTVGTTPPNPWGLYDVHGNVEEWCHDWYGPYEAGPQVDPVGRAAGSFRVTRGGSHTTAPYYLRSTNRLGTLPEDRTWLIGFRVALAPLPATAPLPLPPPPLNQRDVSPSAPRDLARGPDPSRPYFRGPRTYVKIPPGSFGPMFSRHNHDPGIAACANGDLLAIWYSCLDEAGRELGEAASRLRFGHDEWEAASPFWNPPDRNAHAPALWVDGDGTVYHFSGLAASGTWGNLALVQRTSRDHGATWSKARLIDPEHGRRPGGRSHHMPVESTFQTRDGTIVLPCDSDGGTVLHLSRDRGQTWTEARGAIAGIHAGVVALNDGRFLALGRGQNIQGKIPQSLSADLGETWTRSPTPFPGIRTRQRLVLHRLKEGPLFLASFAGTVPISYGARVVPQTNGDPLTVTDAAGKTRQASGLFAALSFDEGQTWPVRRPITVEGPSRTLPLTFGGQFTLDANSGEPTGYLAACQAADGVIHLITSQREYAFNLAWLKAPMPPEPERR